MKLAIVMDEFALINQFFKPLDCQNDEVLLGIGDDAACLRLAAGLNLLVSTDTLVAGVHFLPEWPAYDIAWRALRVNVSDMAAMAATPRWATLALTLPELDSAWLASFAQGLKDALQQFNMSLIGGDTTRGPLAITLTILGTAPEGQVLSRSGAQAGDIVLVSGELGAAALAIELLDAQIPQLEKDVLMNKLLHPNPRVDLIHLLRAHATAAIDISDGLAADLNHICMASGIGACLNEEALPIHPLLNKYVAANAVELALTGGDDYELCFTVPEKKLPLLLAELQQAELSCYPVGVIETEPGLRSKNTANQCQVLKATGYTHF